MSILLKGMEMPKVGSKIITIYANGKVLYDGDYTKAVPVPEPHGRLISADELIEFIENRYEITWKDDYEGGIKDACVDILEKISTMPRYSSSESKERPVFMPQYELTPLSKEGGVMEHQMTETESNDYTDAMAELGDAQNLLMDGEYELSRECVKTASKIITHMIQLRKRRKNLED